MRKFLAFLAVVTVAACDSRVGSSFVSPQTPTIVGSFKLLTFNGRTLPTVIDASATDTTSVVGDTLTLASDKSLARTFVTRTTPPASAAVQVTNENGSYTLTSGVLSAITLRIGSNTFSFPATQSGSQITVVDNGDLWVYQKF
jgi:hypothetical protein